MSAGKSPIENFNSDPFTQFRSWFDDAEKSGHYQPDAITLATASKLGRPTARMVLFKSLTNNAFVFFTNYESQKAADLAENPQAALVFYWSKLYRQIRVEGSVSRISRSDSEKYFLSRPRGSQLAAWASQQSHTLKSRAELLAKYDELEKQYASQAIPCPPFWGGYALAPDKIEFWAGQENRLHHRVSYSLNGSAWESQILAP